MKIVDSRFRGNDKLLMKKFDVITIGSGGGAKISSPAASMGLKVAVIEKDRLGGTCLNRGCIPSKMLIHPADVAIEIKEAHRFDLHNDPQFSVDFAKLVQRISSTVDADSGKIEKSYSNHPNISLYQGSAKFLENKIIEINNEQITADKILLPLGTPCPTIPDIPGLFLKCTVHDIHRKPCSNTHLSHRLDDHHRRRLYWAVKLGHAYGALAYQDHLFSAFKTFYVPHSAMAVMASLQNLKEFSAAIM